MACSSADPSRVIFDRLERLQQLLAELGSVLVAYSGGVDSTFLLRVALDVLEGSDGPDEAPAAQPEMVAALAPRGARVLAVTARSPIRTLSEMTAAAEQARDLGAVHLFIESDELNDPEFVGNPRDRCYLCKRGFVHRLKNLADERGLRAVVDGSNADDLSEARPGLKALREANVRSPLAEAGLTKDDIRVLSRMMGLPTWDKPAAPCLATRLPYGERITLEKLRRIEAAEAFVHSLGFREARVRSHGGLARIEVPRKQLAELLASAEDVVAHLEDLGFAYITMDMRGYRSGSMDEVASDSTP